MDLMMLVPQTENLKNRSERVSNVEHICEVPPEVDELENLIKGSGIFRKIRRWFRGNCMVSRGHPSTRTCFKSNATLNYEKSRHISSHPYMIHPFSALRSLWETIMVFITLLALIVIPVTITFIYDVYDKWVFIILFFDVIFICDIVLHFFTGYYQYHTKVIILDPRIVAWKYLKGFFLADFLSAIPSELVVIVSKRQGGIERYLTVLNLFKIVRLRTIIIYGRWFSSSRRVSFQTSKIIEIFIILFLSLHWAACFEYYVPVIVGEFTGPNRPNQSWIMDDNFKRISNSFEKYVACLHRATVALVCSSQCSPVKVVEDVLLNVILTIIGKIGAIYLLVQFVQLMATLHTTSKKRLQLMQQLQEYIRYKELPYAIQHRLLAYCNYCSKKSFDREKDIMSQISQHLRTELMLHNCGKLVESVEFFRYLPATVLDRMATSFRSEVFLTNDVIVKAGTQGDAMYFIVSGTVSIYTSMGKEVCHLQDGAHFGEIALIMDNELRVASVIAIETCELLVLTKTDFQKAIETHPHLLNRLRQQALERLEKTLLLDEASKQESSLRSNINISNILGKKKE